MSIINIAGGALLLTLGRKIFWFFVAAAGFYAGLELSTRYLNIKPEWVALLIALAVGLMGALLAYFFQKLVIGAAGFLAGAFIASRLLSHLGNPGERLGLAHHPDWGNYRDCPDVCHLRVGADHSFIACRGDPCRRWIKTDRAGGNSIRRPFIHCGLGISGRPEPAHCRFQEKGGRSLNRQARFI